MLPLQDLESPSKLYFWVGRYTSKSGQSGPYIVRDPVRLCAIYFLPYTSKYSRLYFCMTLISCALDLSKKAD